MSRRLAGAVLAGVLGVLVLSGCGGSTASPPAAAVATATPGSAVAAADPTRASVLAMPASRPVRVQIPAIGVDSDLMDLGLQTDGTLEVPPSGFPAGWFTDAPTPGEVGPAVIAGHVDWAGVPGVFAALSDVVVGDEVSIMREDGSTAAFRVSQVEQFAKDAFPTAAVYGDLDHAGLRLITCAGEFDTAAQSYRDNTVVFADLVASPAG
jgi:hypothetical protein